MDEVLKKQRTLDELGRIVIPSNYRKVLKIDKDTALVVMLDKRQIIVKKEDMPHKSAMPFVMPLDKLGRVVIPKQFRFALNINSSQKMDIRINGESIIITKPVNKCSTCGSHSDLYKNGVLVLCKKCLSSFIKLEADL